MKGMKVQEIKNLTDAELRELSFGSKRFASSDRMNGYK